MKFSLAILFFLTLFYSSQAQEPLKTIELPSSLDEISGLEIIEDGKLASVNDEKGKLYILDLKTEELGIQKIDFGKDGDYEGLCAYDSKYYVLKSNGTISVFESDGSNLWVYKRPEAWRGKEFEGICLDKSNNRLLIARKDKKDKILIYAFDLANKAQMEKPVISIEKGPEIKKFKPSGIALFEDRLILISGPSAQILEYKLNEEKIEKLINLDKVKYPQIEGIAINLKGELFITSEKANLNKAYIYQFKNW